MYAYFYIYMLKTHIPTNINVNSYFNILNAPNFVRASYKLTTKPVI